MGQTFRCGVFVTAVVPVHFVARIFVGSRRLTWVLVVRRLAAKVPDPYLRTGLRIWKNVTAYIGV
jgi:hypothetical protein